MKVCEVFVAHQGEVNVGRLGLFIRLSGCNLSCDFCDSKYHKETSVELSVQDIFDQAKCFDYVVITGGEPLLQDKEVYELVKKLRQDNIMINIEIETNGTILPVNYDNVTYNVSPKLSNSGNKYEDRIKESILKKHIQFGSNFKFVVETIEDVDEVNLLIHKLGIPKKQIFLMPKGATKKEQLDNMEGVIKMAKLYGYNFSPRVHIIIFDKLRGV
jgi:7-carboxy-7-deazaguanine synthase